MIVLDTTVLVYAVGSEHPLRDPCRRLISAIAADHVEAGTTVEVIQEFAHVRARRRGNPEAAALAGDFADLLSPLIDVSAEALRSGLRLFAESDRLGAFDSILASVTTTASAKALVSADRAFGDVPGLRVIFPDAAGIEGLLNG